MRIILSLILTVFFSLLLLQLLALVLVILAIMQPQIKGAVPKEGNHVFMIDTSASMSEEILSQVLSELDRIKSVSQCRMTLIECDSTIGKISEIESWELILRGLVHICP